MQGSGMGQPLAGSLSPLSSAQLELLTCREIKHQQRSKRWYLVPQLLLTLCWNTYNTFKKGEQSHTAPLKDHRWLH